MKLLLRGSKILSSHYDTPIQHLGIDVADEIDVMDVKFQTTKVQRKDIDHYWSILQDYIAGVYWCLRGHNVHAIGFAQKENDAPPAQPLSRGVRLRAPAQ